MEPNTGSHLISKNEHGMLGKGGVYKCLSFLTLYVWGGEVENAEVWKLKYGSGSTETKVQKCLVP